MKEHPDTGLIFIDTLQMIREVTGSRGNPYAQDYKEFSAIKKLADKYDICIFVIHQPDEEGTGRSPHNILNLVGAFVGASQEGLCVRIGDLSQVRDHSLTELKKVYAHIQTRGAIYQRGNSRHAA